MVTDTPETYNQKKDRLLGERFGPANNKLGRSILFSFCKQLGFDTCFRCGLPITKLEEFSVEHKIAWVTSSNPAQSFYDLNNIAFSHLVCNSRAGVTTMVSNKKARTHCKNGHEFSEKNTRVVGNIRFCRRCSADSALFHRRKNNIKILRTHCKYGHEFSKENTYIVGGRRQCKTCRTEKQKVYRAGSSTGEHLTGSQKVEGSIPSQSTTG